MGNEPKLDDVVRYLSSFYLGFSVKAVPTIDVRFCSWDEPATKSRAKKRKRNQGAESGTPWASDQGIDQSPPPYSCSP